MRVGGQKSLPLEGKVGDSFANWSDEVEAFLLYLFLNKRINMTPNILTNSFELFLYL